MENLQNFQQMQDEMSRFEAEISGSESVAAGLMQPVIAAGTFGTLQQRMDTAAMPQYQHAGLTAVMFPPMPAPPPPPQIMLVPQQLQQLGTPVYPVHMGPPSHHEFQPSHHQFQPCYHEYQPSYHEYQPSYHEYQPGHHEFQPSHHEFQQSYHVFQPSYHEIQPSHHEFQPSHHEFQPSHHEFQQSHHEFQPSHHEYQPSQHDYQPSHHEFQPSHHEYQPSHHEIQPMQLQHHGMSDPQLIDPPPTLPPAPTWIVVSAKPQLYKIPKVETKKGKREKKRKRKAQLLRAAEEAALTPVPMLQPSPPPPPTPAVHSDAVVKPNKEKKNRKVVRTAGGQVWEDNTLLDWADDDFRMFCGDLGNDVTDELLIRTFAKYTSFQRAKVVRDKRTNKSRGFGFISFKDPGDFIKAMKEMDGRYVGSRPIKLRKSTWKHRSLDVVRKKEKEKQALISLLMTKN